MKNKISVCIVTILLGMLLFFPIQNIFADVNPPNGDGDSQQIGYELIDNNMVLHIWNNCNDYYFNSSSGIQLTNHYNEYWSHNVLMLGYYDGDEWNLLYRTDELSGFNRNIDSDNETYINATLWKDLSYDAYTFRLALRYHLGVDDSDLTIIPYIKNLGIAIPYTLGFGWEIKDIKIDNTVENDQIRINETSYLLNQTINKKYTNITKTVYEYNETTNETTSYIAPDPMFHLDNLNVQTGVTDKTLYLKWNHTLDYLVWIKSRIGQYNAPVTLFIKVGTLGIGQEKSTKLYWFDSGTLFERYIENDIAGISFRGNIQIGQTFTIGNTGDNVPHMVESVKLKVSKFGSPGVGTISIYTVDGDGKPDTITSATLSYNWNNLTTTAAWVEFTFDASALLSPSTEYVIVTTAPLGDKFNIVRWRTDHIDPEYTGGQYVGSADGGSSWTIDDTNDLMFEEYGTAIVSGTVIKILGDVHIRGGHIGGE